MRVSVHIVVSGLVQGVGFRYFVCRHARELGLSGIVKNLPTGEVEVIAAGDRSLLHELVERIRLGPRASRVTGIDLQWSPESTEYGDFQIT